VIPVVLRALGSRLVEALQPAFHVQDAQERRDRGDMALHDSWPQGGVGGLEPGSSGSRIGSTLWASRAASACVMTL